MDLSRAVKTALGMPRPARPPRIKPVGSRFHWRLLLHNPPFLLGSLILLVLLIIALFGPRFAVENPYLSAQRATEVVDGRLATPPFAPSAQFPLGTDRWGRDLLSLLLYGTRNTLVTCLFVTMVRLALGLFLGGLAGWRAGGLLDRLVMSVIEILASLPILVTGMVLIYALDIRRGLVVFMVALSLVGWGEIAQYIRGQFITLRDKPFIEGARATGLTETEIVVRHLLPNILPQLVVLGLLEMGAVLMLLGELGFIGVFIGGGSETETLSGNTLVADIPEWGAILAGARGYLRSVPHIAFYPSLAFFLAVVGFNLTGEGLRRVVEEAGVNTSVLISKRMVAVVAVISLVAWLVVNQISPGASYAGLAKQIDGQNILAHAQRVVELQAAEPGFGQPGARQAAEYIAAQLETCGALPAAGPGEYLQPVTRLVARRLSAPVLAAVDAQGQEIVRLTPGADFGEQVARHGGSGAAQGPLMYIGFGRGAYDYRAWRGLDLSNQVAVYRAEAAPPAFDNEALIRGAQAVLIITDDVTPHIDLGDAGSDMQSPGRPILHLTPAAFDRLVAGEGASLGALEGHSAAWLQGDSAPAWLGIPLQTRVRVQVELSQPEERTGYNVLAILPGNDTAIDDQALVLSTHYDLPEPGAGPRFSAAGDGPAGVGMILEILRLWQSTGFKPRRTVLVQIWAGGYFTSSGAATYLQTPSPQKSLQRQMALHLGGLGSGGGTLVIAAENPQAGDLLARSARVAEVPATLGAIAPHAYQRELAASAVTVAWEDAPSPFRGEDRPEALSAEHLRRAGEVVNLALITASRQYYY